MFDLWSLGGLSLWELLRRTARESWEDSVFGQGGRMAFYQFLAIFPSLLVLFAVVARLPHVDYFFNRLLQDLSQQVLPSQVSNLVTTMMDELSRRAASGFHFVAVCAGASWAAYNATWAMVYGLNRAYEVEERRSRWRLGLTIGGLTLMLGITSCIALFLMLGGAEVEAHFHVGTAVWRGVEWLILILALSFSFALLYRFAPDLRNPEWRWSTPGAACALLLWVGATFAARAYFDRVNDYSFVYGQLNSVVILLLWLYAANGAILIGGEMNSEIEKAAQGSRSVRRPPEYEGDNEANHPARQ
ncbi:MAG TPA: YihY/virulence factor BrkB family protein [Bryobacteraceae bacterium]|nr:YihY/virulence factor BrkB family protein [Bryobacteraceae bacterium]